MNDDLHRLLLKSDRPPSYTGDVVYEGQDFDRDDAVARAQQVRKELSRKFRRYFSLSDDQQDAYFWGDIAEPLGEQMPVRRPVTIRFSFCSNLAGTWTIPGYEPLTPDEKRAVSNILQCHGFTWVDGDLLRASPYDGTYDFSKIRCDDDKITWWDRFFDYE